MVDGGFQLAQIFLQFSDAGGKDMLGSLRGTLELGIKKTGEAKKNGG